MLCKMFASIQIGMGQGRLLWGRVEPVRSLIMEVTKV